MTEHGLFQLGSFPFGDDVLPWKIHGLALTNDDWDALALMLVEMIGSFGSVEAVPVTGQPLADALGKYCTRGPILLVNDQLMDGMDMEKARAGRKVIGGVVFSRAPQTPGWITPIFRMWQ